MVLDKWLNLLRSGVRSGNRKIPENFGMRHKVHHFNILLCWMDQHISIHRHTVTEHILSVQLLLLLYCFVRYSTFINWHNVATLVVDTFKTYQGCQELRMKSNLTQESSSSMIHGRLTTRLHSECGINRKLKQTLRKWAAQEHEILPWCSWWIEYWEQNLCSWTGPLRFL